MVSEHIRLAIVALMETDPRATDADKEAVVRAVTGQAGQDHLLSYADAAAILGCSKTTVGRMARSGQARAVMGTGSRRLGVMASSVLINRKETR